MGTVRLEMNTWVYNAGLAGLIKILKFNEVEPIIRKNYVEFDEEVLNNFEEKYFNYFSNVYESFTSWYKLVSFENFINNFNKNEFTEEKLEYLNNYIDEIKKRLTSNSYKSGYIVIEDNSLNLLEEEKKLKKIKKGKKQKIEDIMEEVQEQLLLLKRIIQYLKKDSVKNIIKAKNVIYDIIQLFWADVSFLNKNNNKNNMYEEYKNYFLEPALNYINTDRKKFKYNCFNCNNKIGKLGKPYAYDITWINKMGVDMSRKSSHFWNFNGDSYICPLCNLIYSCIPAGFTVLKGKGLFINENSSLSNLVSINNLTLSHNTTFEELEEESYFNIVEKLSQSEVETFNKEVENIQVVKLDSQNERRPYTFNLLSKERLNIIYKNRNRLKMLLKIHIKITKDYYINLYREVISRLYNNKNQFDLIYELFSLNLQEKFKLIRYIDTIIKINNDFLGGGKTGKMVYYKVIENFKNYGLSLRKGYTIDKKNAKNKLPGITYRLLNALKTKNTAKFMDTLINAYMYLGKQIPTDFTIALNDVDKFQTIGYSFLLGLQGLEAGEYKNNKEEEKSNE